MFDAEYDVLPCSGYLTGAEDDMYHYLVSMIKKYYFNPSSKRTYIREGEEILDILPEDAGSFEAFVNVMVDRIHDLMQDNRDINIGAGLFIWALLEEQDYIMFFKTDYQSRMMPQIQANGSVTWVKMNQMLPGPSPKANEFFYINMQENTAFVSDTDNIIDGETCNYLAERVLRLSFKPSEKTTVSAIDESAIETIRKCYDEVPQKILSYRAAVADQVTEKGMIDVGELEEVVFADNEVAREAYQEAVVTQGLPRTPVHVSKSTERKFLKKQRMVTDNGIEILIPTNLLTDDAYFEYHVNDDGKMTILLKRIEAIENK